jgi:hypothetical protein
MYCSIDTSSTAVVMIVQDILFKNCPNLYLHTSARSMQVMATSTREHAHAKLTYYLRMVQRQRPLAAAAPAKVKRAVAALRSAAVRLGAFGLTASHGPTNKLAVRRSRKAQEQACCLDLRSKFGFFSQPLLRCLQTNDAGSIPPIRWSQTWKFIRSADDPRPVAGDGIVGGRQDKNACG